MICTKYQVQCTKIFKMQNSILIRISTLYFACLQAGTWYYSMSKFFNRRSEFDITKVSCLPQARFARKKEKENSAKPPRRKELGTIPFRLPAAGRSRKVYFNPISIVFPIYFTKRSGVYFYLISIVFPVRYFVQIKSPYHQN
jgi:hypothetical protein